MDGWMVSAFDITTFSLHIIQSAQDAVHHSPHHCAYVVFTERTDESTHELHNIKNTDTNKYIKESAMSYGSSCSALSMRSTSHSLPVTMATFSLFFHWSATLLSNGSSGLGADSNAWMLSSTVRICSAGDHLSCQITW